MSDRMPTPEQFVRNAQIVCGALPLSPAILAGAAWYMKSTGMAEGPEGLAGNAQVYLYNSLFAFMGIGGAVASFLVKRIMLTAVPRVGAEYAQRRFTVALIACALAELPAVMGLVLVVLTGEFLIPAILFGASVGFVFAHFPTRRFLLGDAAEAPAAEH